MKSNAAITKQLMAGARTEVEGNDPVNSTATGPAYSSECYERRQLIRIRLGKGDWWITVVVYLLTCSLAFILIQ